MLTRFFVFALALGCIPAAFGASGAGAGAFTASFAMSGNEIRHRDLVSFREFLRQHPETAAALGNSPEYVRDRVFLDSNRELDTYLQSHRFFARSLEKHPRAVMARVARLRK